jgi:carbamoyltransferase
LESRHADVARSIQTVTEEVMLRLAKHARRTTGHRDLCLAGGVALNCVANGRLLQEAGFERIWIQPAAGDAGGALGAALLAWHRRHPKPSGSQRAIRSSDDMQGAFLGPAYSAEAIEQVLLRHQAVFERCTEPELVHRVAELLSQEKVVGWFQGRLEFGPRALGHRSILGDPRSPTMQSQLNLKVKFRESFRPFAPAVLTERAADFFQLSGESPYMLIVAQVRPELRRPVDQSIAGFRRLHQVRSTIPAVTHIDGSARVQTVSRERDPLFHELLRQFEARTGCPVLINTSFNVRGEPVVCSPEDAYRCFVNTEMDYLAIGPFLLERLRQPPTECRPAFAPGGD